MPSPWLVVAVAVQISRRGHTAARRILVETTHDCVRLSQIVFPREGTVHQVGDAAQWCRARCILRHDHDIAVSVTVDISSEQRR